MHYTEDTCTFTRNIFYISAFFTSHSTYVKASSKWVSSNIANCTQFLAHLHSTRNHHDRVEVRHKRTPAYLILDLRWCGRDKDMLNPLLWVVPHTEADSPTHKINFSRTGWQIYSFSRRMNCSLLELTSSHSIQLYCMQMCIYSLLVEWNK